MNGFVNLGQTMQTLSREVLPFFKGLLYTVNIYSSCFAQTHVFVVSRCNFEVEKRI